jgi:hypothetical protein
MKMTQRRGARVIFENASGPTEADKVSRYSLEIDP